MHENKIFQSYFKSSTNFPWLSSTENSELCHCLGQSQNVIATEGQSISKSWCRAPPYTSYSLTVTVLFMWGALSDERMGLSFMYAAGPWQRSVSRVQVPSDSWPYFTVSDLRLLFSGPPMTRRVMVEVLDTTSTQVTALVRESNLLYDWTFYHILLGNSNLTCYHVNDSTWNRGNWKHKGTMFSMQLVLEPNKYEWTMLINVFPCGGWVECLHCSPASHKRQKKGKSRI
jgi:hypothetical protein